MNSKSWLLIAALFCLSFCVWFGVRLNAHINFTQDCSGYLERAANANTVEIATQELQKAVKYMEYNRLTEGYTSVLYRTPDEDIGYWYNNMTSALSELMETKADASPLEKSNVLMKLRESIAKNTSEGEKLNIPDGISVYPNNTVLFMWGWLSTIGATFACLVAVLKDGF